MAFPRNPPRIHPGPPMDTMKPTISAIEQSRLLIQARSGDSDAFRRLWETAAQSAFGICFHLTGNRADALDALQDAQIAAWRGLDRFAGRAAFSTWVYAIARNAALALVRRRTAARESSLDAVAADLTDPRPLFDNVVDELVDLRAALARLAPTPREALLLWAGGLTYEQVAVVLEAPVNTVKVWIFRARQELRHLLKP